MILFLVVFETLNINKGIYICRILKIAIPENTIAKQIFQQWNF